MERKYLVLEGVDMAKVMQFTTLPEAYRYWLNDPAKRIIVKVIDVEIKEK